jgi:hypothetical protein
MITKIKREELLQVVTANRDKHREVFLEALDGYRKAAIAELENALNDAKSGKAIFRTTKLIQPMDQTGDYNRAIKMMEMTTEPIIELDEDQFAQLVMNKWHWGKQFSASNRAYVSKSETVAYLASLGGNEQSYGYDSNF